MWYIILYLLFFIAQLFYGSWHVLGPLTPRHIMTFVMLIICLKKNTIIKDQYISLFNIFVVFFILLGLTDGYTTETFSKVIAYYFVSIVAYSSTLLFLRKYNGKNYFVITLLFLGILNSFVTIGNMFMMSWATRVTDFLHVTHNASLLEYVSNRGDGENMEGFAVSGLVADVGNGYFMSYLSVLALYAKDKQIHLYNILIYLLFLVTLFYIQQRAALISGGILSIYALYRVLTMQNKNTKNKRLIIMLIIVSGIIIFLPSIIDYITNGSSRYVTQGFDYDNDDRARLNSMSLEFLLSNPMGGFFNFFYQYGIYPHNLFYNALIYGGIIGGGCLFILLLKQVLLILPTLAKKITANNYDLFFFSLMFLAYNACSISHNQSVVTGDPTFWVLWAFCLMSWKETKKYQNK